MTPSFFESLKSYVGFTDRSSATLREFHPLAKPHFISIVDDFYAAIEAHPGARAAITGGDAQIGRLKQTLIAWIDRMLLGPHDEAYYELRARIGRVHVRIALPQQYMFAAMDRIRVHLIDVVQTQMLQGDPTTAGRICTALNQIIDLELAIMLETYREDLVEKNRNAERLATIGQFAASIGHELRTPLGVVESSLYLVRQHLGADAASAPAVAKHLDRIGAEVKRANQTIADLLDLARNKPPKRQPTDLRLLVESAADASLLPAAVSFESTVPAGLMAAIDATQLRQVMVNLIMNACQAMGAAVTSGPTEKRVPTGACAFAFAMTAPECPTRIGAGSSMHSSPRRPREAASASRSVGTSWRATVEPSRSRTRDQGPASR